MPIQTAPEPKDPKKEPHQSPGDDLPAPPEKREEIELPPRNGGNEMRPM